VGSGIMMLLALQAITTKTKDEKGPQDPFFLGS
jgi:hypothetical protein